MRQINFRGEVNPRGECDTNEEARAGQRDNYIRLTSIYICKSHKKEG